MKDTIVLYPSPGHLVPMVELGKLILQHHHSFCITILLIPLTNTASTAPYIDHVSKSTESIRFLSLPSAPHPMDRSSYSDLETMIFETIHLSNTFVQQALVAMSLTTTIQSLIIDFFCAAALDVAEQLNIPAYYLFASSAADLATFLYFPTMHNTTTKSLKDLNTTFISVPGLPPIRACDMPEPILDRSSKAYEGFLYLSSHLRKAAGILVNTFKSLEPETIQAISDGVCVPEAVTPPVYYIGPVTVSEYQNHVDQGVFGRPKCLTWLDLQPPRSVVFLCFGSLGVFSAEQLKEIAIGLEKSGQRFLWVVRGILPTEDPKTRYLEVEELDLEVLLPKGFLELTKDRGFVMKTWAPQVEVLNHKSVGGFVSHCGWNSVLEAVRGGVPMVAWPLYAEQRINRVLLVKEMKIALWMNDDKDGFVSSHEVEKRVRDLMESEEGKVIMEHVLSMRENAIAAVSDGGSTRVALAEFLDHRRSK